MTLPRAALAVLPLVLAAAVPAPAAAQEVPYTVAVEGAEGELGPLVDRVSRLEELAGKPPPSEVALRRRMDEDRGRIREALRSQGYYDGTVAIDLDGAAQPARVVIRLAPGPQYRLAAVDIESGQVPAPLSPAELGVEPGQPAKAAAVAAAGDKLVTGFGQQGHPLATVTGRQVVVDHHDHTMRVSLTIDPGPFLRFGPVDIAGLASLDPRVVRDRLPWRPGDTFDTRLLEEARRRLADTRLFGTIKVAAGKVAAATGPDRKSVV